MMRRFEYKQVLASAIDPIEQVTAELNNYGAEGWQIVFISNAYKEKCALWLMRELDDR